jgi:pimeloyl-ACP methyl ester carboxylesterase
MVYFISGLGADERVFQFLDLPEIEKRFIKWVAPGQRESLSSYCKKLLQQIDQHQEIILIGISFGGIIAQEIAKLVPCKKVIIISSVKNEGEFSWQLKLVSKLQLHRLVPLWLLQYSNRVTANYYFGIGSKKDALLLKEIITATDPQFLVWAIDRIMNWKQKNAAANLVHIHGTKDRIFPIAKIRPSFEVQHGGHFMIVDKADEVGDIIRLALK